MVVGGGPVPAMIAFLLGAIFLVPVGAVFGELTAAIPISGGIVEYVDRSFGRTLSYITGWLLALGNGILCPWEAIAISTLVSEMFGSLPGLEWLRAVKLYTILGADVYLFPTLIALGFAVYVIFLNFRGASSAAKLQAFLTKARLPGRRDRPGERLVARRVGGELAGQDLAAPPVQDAQPVRVGVGVDPAEDRPAGAGCRFVLHVSLRSFRARLDRADGTLTGRDRMRLFGSAVSLHAPIRSCGGLGSPRPARDMTGNEGSPVGASGMWGHRAVRI